MRTEELHDLENKLRQDLQVENPKHPALKKIYHSTKAAINAYYKALFGHELFDLK